MTDKLIDNKFNEKFQSLPEEVKFFLGSDINGEAITNLASEYKVNLNDVYALGFLAVNYDFDFKILEERIKTLGLSGISLKRFWLDFIGRLLLPIDNYIDKDIALELEKAGGKVEGYKIFVDNFLEALEKHNLEEMLEEAKEYEKHFDVKWESEYLFDLLQNDFLSILSSGKNSIMLLSRSLIFLLYHVDSFKEEALRKFFANKEKVGSKKIIIDEKEVEPTISAWIKDFIKQNGSSIFDDLILAQYINNSVNTKSLSTEDKETLGDVIRFYKNLAFFPESMHNVPPTQWYIFPVKDDEEEEPVKEFKKSKSEDKITEIKEEPVVDIKEDLVEDKVIEKENIADMVFAEEAELEDLHRLMVSFPPASLERKAVVEEIRKITDRMRKS